jgi:branched-chain amino acid transport system substrate-binding protein/urea transport system substrate-binding protein
MATRRQVVAGIGAGMAAASILRGFPAIAQSGPLKVGVLVSETDHDGQDQMIQPYDTQMRLGVDLAVSEINAAGGVLGRQIEVVYRNDGGSPAPGAEAALGLIQEDGCEALVSGFIIAIRSFLTRSLAQAGVQVPVFHAFGTEGTFCGPAIDHLGPTTAQSLQPLVKVLGDKAADKVFTVSDWTPSQRIVSSQLQSTIKPPLIALTGAGLVTTPVEGYMPGEYHDLVRWAKSVGTRTMYVTIPRPYAVNVVKQAAEIGAAEGITFAYLDFSEWQASQLPDRVEVMTCLPFVASDPDPKVQDFVARARRLSGGDLVTHVALTHYNAILALKAAAEKAGEPTGAAALTAMGGLSFDTVTGNVAIDAGHYATMPMYVARGTSAGLEVVEKVAAVESGAKAC